ncbi:MAG: DUF86 domain-containing protein [Chloroflexi bacterium]|nr:DUF86 domain-containing protein [Chloroflexota bacterium]
MRLEARKYLFDIERAAGLVAQFTAGKEFADYEQEDMLRSAVERQFEVIGEALAQLSKLDSVLASRITGYRRIIAFRNILIHGYAEVDSRLVWDVIETNLVTLRREVAELTVER